MNLHDLFGALKNSRTPLKNSYKSPSCIGRTMLKPKLYRTTSGSVHLHLNVSHINRKQNNTNIKFVITEDRYANADFSYHPEWLIS